MGKSGRRKKKLLILGGIVWAILIAALAIWALFDEFRSDPLSPRPWAEEIWNARMRESGPPADHPIAAEGIKISYDRGGEIQASYPFEMPGAVPRSIVEAKPNTLEAELVDGLTVRLSALSVVYASGPGDTTSKAFNAATLEPASPAELHQQQLPWFGDDTAHELEAIRAPISGKAEFRFFVTADSRGGPIAFSRFMLFDPATHNSWESEDWSGTLTVDDYRRYGVSIPFHLYRFHDRPLRLVVEVTHGPSELLSLAPKAGDVAVGEQFVCQLVDIQRARSVTTRSIGDGLFAGQYGVSSESNPSTVMLLGFSGDSNQSQQSIHVETKDGKWHSAPVRGWKLATARISNIVPEDIISIEVEVPRQKLVVFDLPRIPGMPEANSAPSNLFSVEAPFLTIRDETDLQQLLRDAAQFEGWVDAPDFPETWFPRSYHRTSIRKIMSEYLSEANQPYYLDRGQFLLTETNKPKWRLWVDEKWEGAKGWFD
ncbi:MAG: hypothetical protein ACI8UO_000369 [Verrucomicrobiales bacterium]|jgi:hypothetical protein